MPKLSELVSDQADAIIHLETGDVAVIYRPRVVTPGWQTKIGVAEAAPETGYEEVLYTPLKEVLIAWDLEQDDGTAYPITSEAMADIPRVVLSSVLLGVVLAARPNRETLLGTSTERSSAPSTPTRKSRPTSNGTS